MSDCLIAFLKNCISISIRSIYYILCNVFAKSPSSYNVYVLFLHKICHQFCRVSHIFDSVCCISEVSPCHLIHSSVPSIFCKLIIRFRGSWLIKHCLFEWQDLFSEVVYISIRYYLNIFLIVLLLCYWCSFQNLLIISNCKMMVFIFCHFFLYQLKYFYKTKLHQLFDYSLGPDYTQMK